MEQLLIETASKDTSAAIKEFAGRFADASVSVQEVHNESYYIETYGMDKETFENRLNIGVAECVLGMTRGWDEVKAELTARMVAK